MPLNRVTRLSRVTRLKMMHAISYQQYISISPVKQRVNRMNAAIRRL